MVDVTDGPDVEVGLGPLELLLRHCLLLLTPRYDTPRNLRFLGDPVCLLFIGMLFSDLLPPPSFLASPRND